MKRIQPALLALVLAVPFFTAGCGSSVPTAKVDITLTYKGQPVSDVVVAFNSESLDGNRPAVGRTDAQGKVTGVTTVKPNDGVIPGDYVLTLSKPMNVSETIDDAAAYADTSGQNLGFPAKYMAPQTSDLKITVVKGEANQKTFDLTD
jgi:hypothetical protein